MQRKTFLTLLGSVGLVVGAVALLAPSVLLAGKGVPPAPAPVVWMRETGAVILALSTILVLVRAEPDSQTLRSVLVGSAVAHVCLLPIEIVAWHGGVITRLDGIAPSSILHVVAAVGLVVFASRVTRGVEAAPVPRT